MLSILSVYEATVTWCRHDIIRIKNYVVSTIVFFVVSGIILRNVFEAIKLWYRYNVARIIACVVVLYLPNINELNLAIFS